jgi:hypothetical protein
MRTVAATTEAIMSSEDRINPLFLKAAVIVLLTIILLIPLHQVESLIGERSSLRDSAVERVARGVGPHYCSVPSHYLACLLP